MDPDPSSFVLFAGFDYSQLFSGVIVLVLLLCSALVSGSEIALFSLARTDFPEERDDFSAKQDALWHLLDSPQRLLATILVANTFVNIAIVLLFDNLVDQVFNDVDFLFWGVNFEFVIKVGVTTFFLLLFGEILPKIYAARQNVEFSLLMATPLHFLNKILSIFSIPMSSVTKTIQKRLGKSNSGLSVDQLSQALDLADEKDTTEEEHEILQSIVSFGNTDTKQVMKPRTEVFALNMEDSYTEILDKIIENGYSRIPVYKESLDNVIGILYVKDLLPHLGKSELKWTDLLREAYFVPENKKLDDLLNEFKELKIHLAIVVDEYGGTKGLVTMEDIIEEIVGEISDEFDEDDLFYSKLDENTFVFEGKTSLVDFYRIARIEENEIFEEHKGDAESIAGFILEIFGGFPKKGEVVPFNQYSFTIEAVDLKRIIQVKFSKHE